MNKNNKVYLSLILFLGVYSCVSPNNTNLINSSPSPSKSSNPIVSQSPAINSLNPVIIPSIFNNITNGLIPIVSPNPLSEIKSGLNPIIVPTSIPSSNLINNESSSVSGSGSSSVGSISTLKVTNISISNEQIDLESGKTFQLFSNVSFDNGDISNSVNWVSSDEPIATVNSNGLINTLKNGIVKIRVVSKQDSSFFKECIIQIKEKIIPVTVDLEKTSTNIVLNNSENLKAIVKYSDGTYNTNLSWISLDPSIAKINNDGLLVAQKLGETTINISSSQNPAIFSTIKVKVNASNNIITNTLDKNIQSVNPLTGISSPSSLNIPVDIDIDSKGNIFFLDASSSKLRVITPLGIIIEVLGSTGGALGLHIDSQDNIYLASPQRVAKINNETFQVTLIAGDGTGLNYDAPEGEDASKVSFLVLADLVTDKSGNLFLADQLAHQIKKIDIKTGKVYTVAGDGFNFINYGRRGQDNVLATETSLSEPFSIDFDSRGNIYFSDKFLHVIRKIDAVTGVISTYAGNYISGDKGQGGLATEASINTPFYIKFDKNDNLYFTEYSGHKLKKIDKNGILSDVAGTGKKNNSSDNVLATSSDLNIPAGIAFDKDGNILLCDALNSKIKKITLNKY